MSKRFLSAVSALLACVTCTVRAADVAKPSTQPVVPQIHPDETPAQRDTRMAWWREARFGMFIHWGLYAVPAGEYDGKQVKGIGEWIMKNGNIPVATYAKYAERFNPEKFDADAFVGLAKSAGMKYIVITAKHHDGFAMYPSKVSSYNLNSATPFKRDPLRELADACKKNGIRFGLYYSQAQDWHHAGGGIYGKPWDPDQEGSFDTYLDTVSIPQVKEILTSYDPAVLWFDTPASMNAERAARFMPVLREHPGLIVNNRLGAGVKGDTETPEQHIPPQGYPGRDWETCMTLNDTWGYKSYDTNFKSTSTLLRNLIDIASKGGNYLLNVGPTAEGVIPEPEVQRLKEVGQWLDTNGEAIYGCGPTPFGSEAGAYSDTEKDKNGKPVWKASWDWRCTTKPGKLYFHLLKYPADKFDVVGVKGTVTKAYLLSDPNRTPLKMTQTGDGISVALPPQPATLPPTVVCVELESVPK